MRNKVQQAIAAQVRRRPAGAVFSAKDFAALGSRAAVDQALHRLMAQGVIRRIQRGLYDKPKYSTYLKTTLRRRRNGRANGAKHSCEGSSTDQALAFQFSDRLIDEYHIHDYSAFRAILPP